ncbi:hypothetical protein M0R45_034770 [Rubus argutus]|uniref:Uncharacterized protein n=1 Tax=Rubus argutus TaxID=59490 RepID=A0AAW1VSS0_RUBAR
MAEGRTGFLAAMGTARSTPGLGCGGRLNRRRRAQIGVVICPENERIRGDGYELCGVDSSDDIVKPGLQLCGLCTVVVGKSCGNGGLGLDGFCDSCGLIAGQRIVGFGYGGE